MWLLELSHSTVVPISGHMISGIFLVLFVCLMHDFTVVVFVGIQMASVLVFVEIQMASALVSVGIQMASALVFVGILMASA